MSLFFIKFFKFWRKFWSFSNLIDLNEILYIFQIYIRLNDFFLLKDILK